MKSLCTHAPGIAPALLLTALSGLLAAGPAAAAPQPPSAPATTDGNYAVTYTGCTSSSNCLAYWLEERAAPSGAWQTVTGSFTGKAAGMYSYRTAEIHCDMAYGSCFTDYSAAVTVTVVGFDAPPHDPLEVQLGYRYSVRVGNVVGDAGTDILLERTTEPGAGFGVIDSLILQQVGGSFRAVLPTQAQLNTSLWRSSNLHVAVEDMNADGYADIAVRNVASAIPGVADQLVFAPGGTGAAQPMGVRSLDDSLQAFTRDTIDYVANNAYFSSNARLKTVIYVYRYNYCPSSGIDDYSMTRMLACVDTYFYATGVEPDYSAFDSDAVAIWRDEQAVAAGDLPQSTAADRIARRIEDAIGVGIGGWDLREIFGSGKGIDDPAERRGLDGFLAVIGIGNAWGQDDDADDDDGADGVPGPREPDKIYIVGRYLFGSSVNKMHTAVLYHMPVTGVPTWYSAFDSDDRALFDGVLTARTSDPADSPLLMRMTLGEAVPLSGEPRFSYFFVNMLAAHDHYRGLSSASRARYDAIPEIPCGGCNGRNSNGYVHGLIAATNGVPQPAQGINLNGLTGWEYPVERHYFGR